MIPVVVALGSLDGGPQLLVGGVEGLPLPALVPQEPPLLQGLLALLVPVLEGLLMQAPGLQQLATHRLPLLLCLLQLPADHLHLGGGVEQHPSGPVITTEEALLDLH